MTLLDRLTQQMLGGSRARQECLHNANVTVVSTGWERVICEGCGHLSFRYLAELNAKVDRSAFVRDVDRLAAAG